MMPWTADRVITTLEEGGRTLLSLPNSRSRPAGFQRAAAEFLTELIFTDQRANAPQPSSAAIDAMDATLLSWPAMIPDKWSARRRLVARRSLVDPAFPLDRRYLWPWRRLATAEHVSHETCRAWHNAGIEMIVAALNKRAAHHKQEFCKC